MKRRTIRGVDLSKPTIQVGLSMRDLVILQILLDHSRLAGEALTTNTADLAEKLNEAHANLFDALRQGGPA